MIISAIVALAENYVIGSEGDLPWHLPKDLKFFKRTTLHHHIIMGRTTFMSIGRPLPKRSTIILTRDPFFTVSNCIIAHSIGEALSIAKDNGEEEVFIAGGGQIYEQTKSIWDRIYLTKVQTTIDGDTFFPDIDSSQWEKTWHKSFEADDTHKYPFTIQQLDRK